MKKAGWEVASHGYRWIDYQYVHVARTSIGLFINFPTIRLKLQQLPAKRLLLASYTYPSIYLH